MERIKHCVGINQVQKSQKEITPDDRRILLSSALRELLNRCSRGRCIYAKDLEALLSLGDSDTACDRSDGAA
jgi:hypothetical protein